MNERTPRPHLVATLTIWASLELSPNEKIVWYHTWLLDSTPSDGCYISARSMGERLGLSQKTIEGIRSRLVSLELLGSFPRANTVQPGWYGRVPASLVPESRDLIRASREAPALARDLDQRIRGYDAEQSRRKAEASPDIGREAVPRGGGGRFRSSTEESSANARSVRSGEGVGGGVSRLSSEAIERSLPPAVTEHLRQMGDGSHEPENRGERPLSPSERRAMAEREAADRARVEEEGWEKLRRIHSANQRKAGGA